MSKIVKLWSAYGGHGTTLVDLSQVSSVNSAIPEGLRNDDGKWKTCSIVWSEHTVTTLHNGEKVKVRETPEQIYEMMVNRGV